MRRAVSSAVLTVFIIASIGWADTEDGIPKAKFTGPVGGANWFEWNATPDCLYRTCGYDFLGGKVVRGTGTTFEIQFTWKKEMAERFGLLVLTAVEMSPWSDRIESIPDEEDYDEEDYYMNREYPDIFLLDSKGAIIAQFGKKVSTGYRQPLHLDADAHKAAKQAAAKNPHMTLRVVTKADQWKNILPQDTLWGVSVWSLSPSTHGVAVSVEACKAKQKEIADVRSLNRQRAEIIDYMFWAHTDLECKRQQLYTELFRSLVPPEFAEKNYPIKEIMQGDYIEGEFSENLVTLKRIKGNGPKIIVIDDIKNPSPIR